jgi:hypothetical protein
VYLYNKHFPSRKLALGRWILEAIILKVNLLTISGSEVDAKLLDEKCRREIHSIYSQWVTLIQKHVRGFLARRHPKIIIKYDHSYHTASQFSKIRQLSPGSCMKKPFLRKSHKPVPRRSPVATSRPTTPEEFRFPSRAASPYRAQSPNRPKPPSSAPLPLKPTPPLSSGPLRPPRSQQSPRNILTQRVPLAPPAPAIGSQQDESQLYQSSIFVRPLSPQSHLTHSNQLPQEAESVASTELPTIPAVQLYDRLFALDNQDLSVLITGDAHKERERRRNHVSRIRAIETEYILSYLDARTDYDNLFAAASPEQSRYLSGSQSSREIQSRMTNQFPGEADQSHFRSQSSADSSATAALPLRYQFDEAESHPLDDGGDSQYEDETFCSTDSGDEHQAMTAPSDRARRGFYSLGKELRSDAEVVAAAICLQRFVRSRYQRSHTQQRLQAYLSKIPTSSSPQFIHSALVLSLESGNIVLASSALQRIDGLLLAHRFPQSKEQSSFQPTNRADMTLICQVVSAFSSVQSVLLTGVSLLSTLSRIKNVPFLLKQMGDCRCCEVALAGLLRHAKTPRVVNSLMSLLERLLAEPSNRQHLFSRSGCRALEKLITESYAQSSGSGEAQKLLQLTEQAIVGGDKSILSNILESNLLTRLLELMREVLEKRSKSKIEPIVRVFQALAVHRSSGVMSRLTSMDTLRLFCAALLLTKNSAGAYREIATFLLTLLRRSHDSTSLAEKFSQLSRMAIQTMTYLIPCHHPSAKIGDDVLDTSLAFLRSISQWDPCQWEVQKTSLSLYLATSDFKKKFPAYHSLAELYPVGESHARAPVAGQEEEDLVLTYNSEEHLSGVLKVTLAVKLPELTEQLCEDLLFTVHQVYTEPTSSSCLSPCLLLLDEVIRQYPSCNDLQKICLACLDHLLQTMLGDVPSHPYHQLLQLVTLWKADRALLKKYLEVLILFNERCESFAHPIDWTHDHVSLMLQLMAESIDSREFSVLERWSYLFRAISLRFKHRLCLLRGTPILLRILSLPDIPRACKISTLIALPNIYAASCPDCVSELCSTTQLVFCLTSLVSLPEACHEVVAFIIAVLGESSQGASIQTNLFSSTFVELLDNLNRDLDVGGESSAISSEQLLVVLALLVHCLRQIPALRFQLISLGVRSRLLDLQTKVDHIGGDRPHWAEADVTAISRILTHCVDDLPLTPLDASEEDLDSLSELPTAAGGAGNDVLQPAALLDELNQRRHSISVTSPRFSQRYQGGQDPSAVAVKRQNHLLKEMNRIGRADSHDFSHCLTDELISGLTSSTNATFLMTCLARCVEEKSPSFARLVLRRMEVVITEVKEKIRQRKGLEGQLHDSKIVQSIARNFKHFADLMEVFSAESDILAATLLLLKKVPCDPGETDRLAEEGIFPLLHSILVKHAGQGPSPVSASVPAESQGGLDETTALVILTAEYAKQLLLHGGSAIREVAGAHPGTADLLTALFLRLFKHPEQMRSFAHYLLELCHHTPTNQFHLLRSGLGSHLTKYLVENKRDEHLVQLSIRLIFALCAVSTSAPGGATTRQDICIRTLLSHRHLKLYVHTIRSNSSQPKISKILCKFLMLLCSGKEEPIARELERSKVTEDLILMIRDGVSSPPERFHPDCLLHVLMLVGHIVCYFPPLRAEFRSLDLPAILEQFSSAEWSESTMAMVRMLQRLFSVSSVVSPAATTSIVDREPVALTHREALTVGEKEWIDSELSAVAL